MNSNEYAFLDEIMENDFLHAKFLNTLSFIEYTGARMILKSQKESDMSFDKMIHLQEEIRHSLLFKKLALKIYPKELEYDDGGVFCYPISKNYISRIDQPAQNLTSTENCYFLTSYIIEVRALSFYQTYNLKLGNKGPFNLNSILNDEEKHLRDMRESIISKVAQQHIENLIEIETSIFSEFSREISKELACNPDESIRYSNLTI